MNKYKLLIFKVLIISVFYQAQAQEIDTLNTKQRRSAYVNLGLEIGSFRFIDFGTSPRAYAGRSYGINIGGLSVDEISEVAYGLEYDRGIATSLIKNEFTASILNAVNLYYAHLYRLAHLSNDNWNTKIGGLVNSTAQFRLTPAFQNADVGLEIFYNIMASAKVTRDLSRKKTKHKKIWFIKYTLVPRKRSLSYRLNVGAFNNNYRNGYSYIGQSALVNDSQIFDGYELNLFKGTRISSELTYSYHFKNNNAIQLTYFWDAFKAGLDINEFQMSYHTINFSLLFNLR